jgi:hypothetical protein
MAPIGPPRRSARKMLTTLRVNDSYDNIGPSPVFKMLVLQPRLTLANSKMSTPRSLQTHDNNREDTQRATTRKYLATRKRRRP